MSQCPNCRSQNCATLSMIHQSGINTGNFQVAGVGLLAAGKTRNQSLLSQSARPPIYPAWQFGHLVLIFFAFLFPLMFMFKATNNPIFALIIGVAGAGGAIYLIILHLNNKKRIWQADMEQYNHTWQCLACGVRWLR